MSLRLNGEELRHSAGNTLIVADVQTPKLRGRGYASSVSIDVFSQLRWSGYKSVFSVAHCCFIWQLMLEIPCYIQSDIRFGYDLNMA